jgi:hypothetical protein
MLVAKCHRHLPDATPEEIAHFLEVKGRPLFAGNKRIDNPNGLILSAVPECFLGNMSPALRYREQTTTEAHATDEQERIAVERRMELEAQDEAARYTDEAWAALPEPERARRIVQSLAELKRLTSDAIPRVQRIRAEDRAKQLFQKEERR